MPVKVTYIEVTEVFDENGKVLSKTKVKLQKLPTQTIHVLNAPEMFPPHPEMFPATPEMFIAPPEMFPESKVNHILQGPEDLPDLVPKNGIPPLSKEERWAHIQRVNSMVKSNHTVARTNAQPIVMDDPLMVSLTGVEPKFISPDPILITGESGEIDIRTKPRGTGPIPIGGDPEDAPEAKVSMMGETSYSIDE